MSIPHIEPAPDTVHWGFFDASLAPLLTIASGERVTISSVSGSPFAARTRTTRGSSPTARTTLGPGADGLAPRTASGPAPA